MPLTLSSCFGYFQITVWSMTSSPGPGHSTPGQRMTSSTGKRSGPPSLSPRSLGVAPIPPNRRSRHGPLSGRRMTSRGQGMMDTWPVSKNVKCPLCSEPSCAPVRTFRIVVTSYACLTKNRHLLSFKTFIISTMIGFLYPRDWKTGYWLCLS